VCDREKACLFPDLMNVLRTIVICTGLLLHLGIGFDRYWCLISALELALNCLVHKSYNNILKDFGFFFRGFFFFEDYIFCMMKYLSFHNSSFFALRYITYSKGRREASLWIAASFMLFVCSRLISKCTLKIIIMQFVHSSHPGCP